MAASSRKVILAALIGNSLIAVTKFAASAVTGSSAMLSEGVHSLVDTGNQVLLLHGLRRSRLPADDRFPFGHGKEVYFWSFVVAILLFAVGAGVSLYEGIHHILHPEPIGHVVVNYVVLGLAIVFEAGALFVAWRSFDRSRGDMGYLEAVRRGKDPSLFVVLFEDTAAILGLVIALLGIVLGEVTGLAVFDGIASVLIGLLLGGTAVWLAYETKGLLIGESANRPVVEGIRELAGSYAEVGHVNEVLTMHMGPEFILANLSVQFREGLTSEDLEAAIQRLDRDIKQRFSSVRRVFVEAESRRSNAADQPRPDEEAG